MRSLKLMSVIESIKPLPAVFSFDVDTSSWQGGNYIKCSPCHYRDIDGDHLQKLVISKVLERFDVEDMKNKIDQTGTYNACIHFIAVYLMETMKMTSPCKHPQMTGIYKKLQSVLHSMPSKLDKLDEMAVSIWVYVETNGITLEAHTKNAYNLLSIIAERHYGKHNKES